MNVITVCGHLGKDPEIRQLPSGDKVTGLTLATSVGYGDKKTTVWWNISIFSPRWDKMISLLKKGSVVTVTGTLSKAPNAYQKDGEVRISALEITGDIINFVPSSPRQQDSSSEKSSGDLPF